MRYRRYLAALLALLIVGATALFFTRPKPGLIVRGKPVSDWALALGGPAPTGPAQELFKSIGPEVVPDLVRMLRTRDSFFAKPINLLAEKLPKRLEGKLYRLFKPSEPIHRRYTAAMALWLMGTNATPAMPALLGALRDSNMGVSITAAMSLARIGPASLPGLTAALDDRGALVRQAAMTGLSYLGFEAVTAVPKLIVLLERPTDRLPARTALEAIGRSAVPALIELLNHSADEVRLEVIGILGNIGTPARAAIPPLLTLAEDRSQTVRYETLNSLGQICRSCDSVISALQNGLDDESWEVRRVAATHLGAEQRAAQRTVDTLLHRLEQGSPAETHRAIVNLGLMGGAAERAVPVLKSLAEGNSSKEAALAREALRQIEGAMKKN